MFETKEKLLEGIIKILPAPFISDIEMDEPEAIRFYWGEQKYRISTSGFCERVNGKLLECGTPDTKLMTQLIKITAKGL